MLAVPAVAAIACVFAGDRNARLIALAATLIDFALGVMLWANFDIGGAQWQFQEMHRGIFGPFNYALGIDGIALVLIMLSVFLMPLCILASWQSVTKRVGLYMAMFLVMEALLYLLRSWPDPDVFHHRHLGRREPHLCGVQILPLHAARLGADADRDDRDDPRSGDDRYPDAARL
jgi:hypothetical protein